MADAVSVNVISQLLTQSRDLRVLKNFSAGDRGGCGIQQANRVFLQTACGGLLEFPFGYLCSEFESVWNLL
jgi:hypothetical protein